MKNQTNLAGLLLALCLACLAAAACTSALPNTTTSVGPEYGIYWYGQDDANQLATPDRPNPYYDPTRPTVLFVHGWQPNQAYTHRTMLWEFEDAETGETGVIDLAAAWVNKGWNVGVFDWGPYADEDLVLNAEAKIWSVNGSKGMRWRDETGSFRTDNASTVSAGELFYETYVEALADFSGPELRLAGHSLGNQMAASLLSQLAAGIETGDVSDALLPQRLALLDPYWSPVPMDYLNGVTTAQRVRQILEQEVIPRGVLIEWYRSSSLTDGLLISDANEALQAEVVFSELRPRYCNQAEQICKHEAAWQSYFLSFGSAPPPECERADAEGACIATDRVAASASTSHERLAEMLQEPYRWIQTIGPDNIDNSLTRQPADDWFERISAP